LYRKKVKRLTHLRSIGPLEGRNAWKERKNTTTEKERIDQKKSRPLRQKSQMMGWSEKPLSRGNKKKRTKTSSKKTDLRKNLGEGTEYGVH